MTRKNSTKKLTILGLMIGMLLLLAYTPLGYLKVGAIEITFNMIPVAICAIALGPVGGAIAGGVFGLTSFLQCIGVGGLSAFGAMLFSINPFFTVVMTIIPRCLTGFLLGYVFKFAKGHPNVYVGGYVTGFFAAFLNTLFFMVALILLFGKTDYIQEMMAGRNLIAFACWFVGFNAIFEMIASTIITGGVSHALHRARVLPIASDND